jgi:hypothetical protein
MQHIPLGSNVSFSATSGGIACHRQRLRMQQAHPPARATHSPPYRYRYDGPAPVGGFFYRGPGLSIGVGW